MDYWTPAPYGVGDPRLLDPFPTPDWADVLDDVDEEGE